MARADEKDSSAPPGWRWQLLGDYLKERAAKLHSARLAEKLLRQDLNETKRPYRYLDSEGRLRVAAPYGKLWWDGRPECFWLEAVINEAESSASRPAILITPEVSARMGDPLGLRAIARQVDENKALLHWLGAGARTPWRPPERWLPAVEIFRIQVLVPALPTIATAEKPAAGTPAPATPAVPTPTIPTVENLAASKSVETTVSTKASRQRRVYQGSQRGRARTVLKRLFPRDYPTEEELSSPDMWDQFCEEYDRVEGAAKGKKASKFGRPSRATVLREVGRQE